MKKILAILVFLTMVLVSIQAVAADDDDDCCCENCDWVEPDCHTISTTVVVPASGGSGGSSGGGLAGDQGEPIIKCKWEYDLEVMLDPADECCDEYCIYHDACPCIDGLQVKPQLEDYVTVKFFAIVTDPNGPDHVDTVYADVWHPNGEFKYQIILNPVGFDTAGTYDKTEAISEWQHVSTEHHDLITYGPLWEFPEGMTMDEDIYDELVQEEAYLYTAEAEISYCQPAGDYYVGVIAIDLLDMWCDYVINSFLYIPTAAIDLDFDTVDYGDVVVSTWAPVGGDYIFGTPDHPTVKNIGNVPVFLTIEQDDMGFGTTSGVGPNVEFNARMNENGAWAGPYDPDTEVVIPGVLNLCSEDKLDFKIHVIKRLFPDGTPNTGTMELCAKIHGADWNTWADLTTPFWEPLSPELDHIFDPAPQGIPQNILPFIP